MTKDAPCFEEHYIVREIRYARVGPFAGVFSRTTGLLHRQDLYQFPLTIICIIEENALICR